MWKRSIGIAVTTVAAGMTLLVATGAGKPALRAQPTPPAYIANDSHLHLTNYIQEGPDLASIVPLMGDKIGRAALFGIPLQQDWSYRLNGKAAPAYYLDTDADLYYYSFTDAYIAMAYRGLSKAMQARFD